MNLISTNRVIERLLNEFPFENEFDKSIANEWMASALSLIGATTPFQLKITDGANGNPEPLQVVNYKVMLPTDCYRIITLRNFEDKSPLIHSSDLFHSNTAQYLEQDDYTYKIEGNYIKTGVDDISIELAYYAWYTDEEGMLMILDYEPLIIALEYAVAERIANKLWLSDKMSRDKYDYINQKMLFYRKAAKGIDYPKIDQLETIKNQMISIIPILHEHSKSFYNLGKPR